MWIVSEFIVGRVVEIGELKAWYGRWGLIVETDKEQVRLVEGILPGKHVKIECSSLGILQRTHDAMIERRLWQIAEAVADPAHYNGCDQGASCVYCDAERVNDYGDEASLEIEHEPGCVVVMARALVAMRAIRGAPKEVHEKEDVEEFAKLTDCEEAASADAPLRGGGE
jgi:hypothetical protein